MRKLLLVAFIFALAGCNQGQHLGQFKTDCQEKGGKLVTVSPNNYECHLPDGSVLKSK